MLKIHTLGRFELRYGNNPLALPATIKARALLAYLIMHRERSSPRERLAELFWGDRPDHRARRSLATALWHIRRCLPEDYLLSDIQSVQFDPQADMWLDAEAFEAKATHPDVANLQSALDLYCGDFLDGFYDDWVINERYRLQAVFSETLARLMVGYEVGAEHVSALSTALRLLEHDPLREDAHRLVMRAYCRLGQRNAALEQYRHCREIVGRDLDAEPMVETTELYHAILEGRFAVGRATKVLPAQVAAVEPAPPLGRDPLDVITTSPLVGREGELAFLQGCWQEAISRSGRGAVSRVSRGAEAGQGRLVLIGGEAGVGKTRLVEEFANRLRWQGVRVLWGRCYEFERVLSYQPFAEALRSILPLLTPTELADSPAWTIGEVARLLPEAAEYFPDLEAPPSGDTGEEQACLFEGLARFLAELSSHGALLIVLEDLHWASESTLGLAHYLVRHLAGRPVLMVGTFRQELAGRRHPLRSLEQQLSQEGLVKPLRLPRLSPAAVEAMVIEMSGAGGAIEPLAARLYRETEGNPFFLMEAIKALFETGMIDLEGSAWRGDFARLSGGGLPLPSSVSDAIHTRVRGLDDKVREALRIAAVLGREFDFDLLNAVWGRGEETALEALDDLLRRRLIEEGAGPLGRDYAFTHHKIQEVVYAEIPRRHRGHAHVRVGAAMESLYGPETEASAGELAFHFEQGQKFDKTLAEKAIAYLHQAGDRARGLYAHQEAIDYYQRALALLKEQGDAGRERAARTLMKLGLTYHTAFDFYQARQAYEEGFTLWQPAGEMEMTVPLPSAPHAFRVNWPPPTTLDPTMAYEVADIVLWQLFSGLVMDSPEMEIIPDVAQSWEVSEGGRKYVFHLRDDVRWSDREPVTAGDFEYAWKRVLDPDTGSPLASLLYDVKGARPFHQGEVSDPDCIGVKALDETTLVVELEGPTAYFLHVLLSFPAIPHHVVATQGDAWAEPGNIVCNGPFILERWQPGVFMVLARNPEYCGQFRGNLQRVEVSLGADPSALLEMYEVDDLDILDLRGLSPSEIDRVRQRHAGEYLSLPWPRTHYVGFNASWPPFDNPHVRQAFVLSIDREALADVVLRGYQSPATGGFVPPGIPGHSAGIGLPYRPDQARRLLAEAGYPDGRAFPTLEALRFREADEPASDYLKSQWREVLGVEIVWETVETYHQLNRDPSPVFLSYWLADYPDPDSFLRASPVRHWTRWRNETFDRLVDEARRITDWGKRMETYHEAESVLVKEAAILPLTYDRRHLLVKPWVSKCPTSTLFVWFWKDAIIEPH